MLEFGAWPRWVPRSASRSTAGTMLGVIAKRVCSGWVLGTRLVVHSEQMPQAISALVMPSSAL